ncbi:DUF1992 domain-containing protein [Azoarcus communis]|uniref:DnaJ family domain-containing protein n=1 Tax=Parazoarcus communis TaxID=41977 RepID=UPI00145942D8|nr:DUF1992 domain-containing protein [Parazoarcus communis]NMG50598.1 DUF1992 domain-containing protein [Parazoarcus communis]
MNLFDILAEQRIAEAFRRGEFEHLPGAGRPLVFDDDPFLSPETRMMNRILKNAGCAPAEVGLRRELAALRAELAALPAGAQRDTLMQRRNHLLLQLAQTSRN